MAVKIAGKSVKELREEKATLATEIQSHLNANEDNWTEECESKHGTMFADVQQLSSAISRRETLEKHLHSDGGKQPAGGGDPREAPGRVATNDKNKILVRGYDRGPKGQAQYIEVDHGARGSNEYQAAFRSYLRQGVRGLTPDQHAQLQSDNAQQAGYLTTDEQFAAGLLKDVDDLLFIRQHATVHTVRTASSLGIRKRTRRLASANWGGELTQPMLDQSLAFGKKVLTPHYMTQGIAVSRDLIRRAVMDIDQIVREELARDSAELEEDAYLYGDGQGKPLGLFVPTAPGPNADGITTARDRVCGSATAITAAGLVDVKYGLKQQYRSGSLGSVRWLFHRDAIAQIAKLKIEDGNFIWQPGLQADEPDRILGLPFDESERAPNTFTAGQYVGLLGNYRYYEIADALDMDLLILTESPYAEKNLQGYINRRKVDGMPTLEEAFVRLKLGA